MKSDSLKYKAITNTFWKFLERILAQGISLIVSIIIARILSPDDYSVVAFVSIFFAFSNVIISGGLGTALIQKKDADSEDYSTVLHVSLIISIIIYIILFFVAKPLAVWFKNDQIVLIFRIMGLSLPVVTVKSIWSSYISSHLKFKKFFFATLGGTICSAVIGIVMALKGYGAWALVAQQMTNIIIDTVILVITTRIGIVPRINFKKLKSLFSYGWKIFISSLIGTAYVQLSPLIISGKFKSADLSFYTKGKMFPETISSTINYTLSSVLFPVLSKKQDDKNEILRYTRLFMNVSSYIIFPILLGFFMVAENFVVVLLTDKWLPAAYYIKLFCIACMFDVISVGNCESIKAIGKSGTYLIMEMIKKISYLLIIVLFSFISKTPEMFVISAVCCAIVAFFVNVVPNKKIIKYRYRDQFIDIFPNLLISLLMAAFVYFVGYSNGFEYGIIPLIKQVILGILIYFILSYLFKNKSLKYIIETIKQFRHK